MRAFWHGLVFALLLALQACGGGTEGDAPPPAAPFSLPELSGTVADGVADTSVAGLQITVKGNVGTARTAEGRLLRTGGVDFLVTLDQLSGPYLLSNNAGGGAGGTGLFSVATRAGTANLTPLTTLLVAQLLGAEPAATFAGLGARGGFTAADDAAVAAAEQRVRRLLQREHGLELPAAVGAFVTTPFERVPGDPMFDALQALAARLAPDGDYRALITRFAQESARCQAERVAVTGAAAADDLCPLDKLNEVDAQDAGVRRVGFTNRHGDRLTLRLRGTAVLDIELATPTGEAFRCSGATCVGVTAGAPAADGTQSILLEGTILFGPDGTVRLAGTLATSRPGITLPGLACNINLFYLIREAAGTAEGFCTTPDDFGLGASGSHQRSGAARRNFVFSDGVGGPTLEVVVEGVAVVRALVYDTDPNTGLPVPRYQCRGASGCAGFTLGAATADESLGVRIVLLPLRAERVVLPAVLPDGSLSATESVLIDAALTGWYVDDPNAGPPPQPLACDAAAPTVTVSLDTEPAVAVCEPPDPLGNVLRSSFVDGDGNLVFSFAGVLSSGQGDSAVGNGITLTLSPAGDLVSLAFDQFDGPRYACRAAACNGVNVSAPDGAGERTIGFTGTLLQEQGSAGLPADRQATLSGGFVALPLP